MTRLPQDLRYAWRTLRGSPTFSMVAAATLALGIGANTAIFTVINAALLAPLPFPAPERLALVWEDTSMFGLKDSPAALGNYTDWRAQNHVFEQMGALEGRFFRLTSAGEAQQVLGAVATASLLPTLGVKPALGRLFREEDDRPGAPKTAILSDGLWRSAFGSDRAIVGRLVEINDEKYEVIGILPAGFRFPDSATEIWAPVATAYGPDELVRRGRHNWMVVGRLKPGVTLAQANEELPAIALRAQKDYPDTNYRVGAFVAPLREHFVSDLRPALKVLGGAVAFVLLIACANIANLLLARASNRAREIAIRAAVGASRWQVARQLLTENLLLAGAGGVGGFLLAVWGVRFLPRLMPGGISGMSAVRVDWRVLAFTLGVSLFTGVAFGLAPAFQTLRVDLHRTLKQGGRQGTGGASRGLERLLVVSEVALAFVLTLGAALMIQAAARLRAVDPGFPTRNLLTMNTSLSGRQYREHANRMVFYDEVVRRVTALPGVKSAGFTLGVPLAFKGWINGFEVEGRVARSGDGYSNSNYRVVTADYLQTVGFPLRAGRYPDRRDADGAPLVLLVNEAMQQRFWPGQSAIGKRIRFATAFPWVTVVGVVGDIKQAGLDAPPKPEIYLPVTQQHVAIEGLVIRTGADPNSLVAAVRREIRAVDRGVSVTGVQTMEEVLDREVFQRRAQTLLLSVFAGLALLLASLGIYGVLAYAVTRRTREIGVRMALGARPANVLCTVAGEGVGLGAAGIAIGAAVAFGVTRVLAKLLFGISATDPATFASVASVLLLVASLASYIPARRAMRVDPIQALRDE